MPEDGKVVFRYVGDDKDIDKTNARVEGKLKGFSAKLGGLAASIGVASVAAIGAAAVKVTKDIVMVGVSFESAFAGVIKTVNATEEELAQIRTGILDMSKVLPASADEIAGVAEAAGQLGIQTENVLEFTRAMIDLGESTNMTADQAATALARFANIVQMPQTQFDRLGATIVDLGNNSATTEAEIVDMGLRIAGAGKQASMTEADIMGIAAALSSLGINAEAGGTAISKVITEINVAVQTGSSALEDYAHVAGMSASQFRAAFEEDAAGALALFIEGLGTMDERGSSAILALENMGIAEIRMRDALLRASGAGDLMTESIERGNEAWEENTALTEEAARRYETLESRFEMFKNQIKGIAIQFFDEMRPALSQVLEGLSGMITKMEENGTIKAYAEAVGNLVLALSDLIVMLMELEPSLQIPIFQLALFGDTLSVVIGLVGVLINSLEALRATVYGQKNLAQAAWDRARDMAKVAERPFTSKGGIASVVDSFSGSNYTPSSVQQSGEYEYTDEEFFKDWGFYPGNAKGTSFWRGGLTWVGEEGPEIVDLPTGSRIYPADVSAQMMVMPSTRGGMTVGAINVYPDSATYSKIIALLESSARARQDSRAGGY